MSGESLPSGVLKVADLLNEARIEGDSRYTLRTSAVAFAKGAEFALNIARRHLASPPPQATGAPQWLPIESAPRDGTTIILGYISGHPSIQGQSEEGYYMGDASRNHWQRTGWFATGDDVLCDQPSSPDVWQPLPAPPAASQVEPEDKQ